MWWSSSSSKRFVVWSLAFVYSQSIDCVVCLISLKLMINLIDSINRNRLVSLSKNLISKFKIQIQISIVSEEKYGLPVYCFRFLALFSIFGLVLVRSSISHSLSLFKWKPINHMIIDCFLNESKLGRVFFSLNIKIQMTEMRRKKKIQRNGNFLLFR